MMQKLHEELGQFYFHRSQNLSHKKPKMRLTEATAIGDAEHYRDSISFDQGESLSQENLLDQNVRRGNHIATRESVCLKWQSIEAVLTTHFEDPDLDAVRIILSAAAAHNLADYPPAWLFLIAPSGSMKTVILTTLHGLQNVHFVDEVTPNTFISGQRDEPGTKRRTPASLLHRIGSQGILICGDFSTMLAMDSRKQPIIMAQLRRIYDGNFNREFGTGENLEENSWEGRLTILAGVTPDIDRHHGTIQSLGERFLKVRWPRPSGIKTGLRAVRQTSASKALLRSAVCDLMKPILLRQPDDVPTFAGSYEESLVHLSEFVLLARAHVPRERSTHIIDGEPQPEGNTRLPQQLAQIGRGWAVIEGAKTVSSEGMRLIRRVGLDCIPPARRTVLTTLMSSCSAYSTEESSAVIFRAIEDLEAVGLVVRRNQTAKLSDIGLSLAKCAGFTFPQNAVDTAEE